jgi:hypothetical protein
MIGILGTGWEDGDTLGVLGPAVPKSGKPVYMVFLIIFQTGLNLQGKLSNRQEKIDHPLVEEG